MHKYPFQFGKRDVANLTKIFWNKQLFSSKQVFKQNKWKLETVRVLMTHFWIKMFFMEENIKYLLGCVYNEIHFKVNTVII